MATANSLKVRTLAAVTVAFATVGVAALGAAGAARPAPSARTGEAATMVPGSPYLLAGTWTRWGTCREVVDVLRRYGLDEFAPAAVFAQRFHPGGGEPVLDESCNGTIGRHLTEVFAPDGRFSAFNGLGEQVGTDAYRPTGEQEVILDRYNGIRVNYRTSGAALVFDVTLPVPCATQRCRLTAQDAVATFLPGEPWVRA